MENSSTATTGAASVRVGAVATVRLATFAALAAALVAPAKALEITLPAETAKLIESPLPGYALAQSMCLTCHSPDYMRIQPPSGRAYWQATVTKMQKTFAAPLPDSAISPIVDYLAKTYGMERTTASEQSRAKESQPTSAAPSPQPR